MARAKRVEVGDGSQIARKNPGKTVIDKKGSRFRSGTTAGGRPYNSAVNSKSGRSRTEVTTLDNPWSGRSVQNVKVKSGHDSPAAKYRVSETRYHDITSRKIAKGPVKPVKTSRK